MSDSNRYQWEERSRSDWQNRNNRNDQGRSRDDYSSNYSNDYRRNRREDLSDFERSRDISPNVGSGYDPYNYGQTVGSFNQGKEGSYTSHFDHNDQRRKSNDYDDRYSGYDSDYNRSYGRRDSNNNNGSGSYYGNNYRDSYQSKNSDWNTKRTDRDWWDKTTDEVASWFGDNDAQGRRARDKAEGPYRGKGPKGYTRSDDRIKDDINDRLSDDSFIDASEIDVTVENCEVVLSGSVDTREEKRRAEDIAERVTAVKNVENRLRVKNKEGKDGGATIYRDRY